MEDNLFDTLKKRVESEIGRPVEVVKLPNGRYFVEFFDWNHRHAAPMGATMVEALEKFLERKHPCPTGSQVGN